MEDVGDVDGVNEVRQGWTGRKCIPCNGYGERYHAVTDKDGPCRDCGGTGEEYGDIPDAEPRTQVVPHG
jgi:hypothetical protein